MHIRVLEWIGLIMADMLSFLVVGIAFLYTFTEPVQEAKVRRQAQSQQSEITQLQQQVGALKLKLKKQQKKTTAQRPTRTDQAYIRLFPGDLIVLAGSTGQPQRLERDKLKAALKDLAKNGKTPLDLVLSAEDGVSYDQLTKLAETLLPLKGVSVRFGW